MVAALTAGTARSEGSNHINGRDGRMAAAVTAGAAASDGSNRSNGRNSRTAVTAVTAKIAGYKGEGREQQQNY